MTRVDQVDRALWARRVDDRAAVTRLRADIDVVVAGGGITGLTAALLLASDKRRVALLGARHLGAGTTGSTTDVPQEEVALE
jgi:ribulose 1,5-bisphosphate synthetase/thiazole synthase